MATGVAVIDNQHRYLIEIRQQANEKLLHDTDDDALLSRIGKELLGYAITHFENEEALMRDYGYEAARPEEALAYIAQHRDFSRRVVAVRDQLREGEKVSREELLRFLNHWLGNHVLGIDQALGKYLMQNSGLKQEGQFEALGKDRPNPLERHFTSFGFPVPQGYEANLFTEAAPSFGLATGTGVGFIFRATDTLHGRTTDGTCQAGFPA